MATVGVKGLNSFDTIPACKGQTDRQTDGQTDADATSTLRVTFVNKCGQAITVITDEICCFCIAASMSSAVSCMLFLRYVDTKQGFNACGSLHTDSEAATLSSE